MTVLNSLLMSGFSVHPYPMGADLRASPQSDGAVKSKISTSEKLKGSVRASLSPEAMTLLQGRAPKDAARSDTVATALARIEEGQRQTSAARKEEAKRRVMELVERLKTLKMMGNFTTRQMADMAKELKAAVKAYQEAGSSSQKLSASGAEGDLAGAGASGPDVTAAASEAAAPVSPHKDEVGPDPASPEPQGHEDGSNKVEASNPESDKGQAEASNTPPVDQAAPAPEAMNATRSRALTTEPGMSNQDRVAAADYAKTQSAREDSATTEDKEFAKLVRDLSKKMKELMQKAKLDHKDDIKAFKDSLRDVDRMSAQIFGIQDTGRLMAVSV